MEDITSGISELTITPDRRCLLLREYISKHPSAGRRLNILWQAHIVDATNHLYMNSTAINLLNILTEVLPPELTAKLFGGPLAVENATNVQMLKREFQDVAEFLVTLFPYTPPPKKTEENMDAETLSELANLLANAFRQSCRGDAPKRLHGAIKVFDCMYDPALHFGKVVAITAASCAGKTFTACYVSNYEVSIYICFRAMYQVDQPVTPDQGWPPQDTPACRFFYAHKDAMWKGEELAAAFLGALFTVMAEKLEGCEELSQFNAHWVIDKAADLEHSTRFKTFLEVEAKANKILESTSWLELRKVHHFDAAGPNAEIGATNALICRFLTCLFAYQSIFPPGTNHCSKHVFGARSKPSMPQESSIDLANTSSSPWTSALNLAMITNAGRVMSLKIVYH
ncbi:hypothetical protein HGRIS_003533 [Hohenbuehelia grisea]|uniref:Uncharacterized protein n=1 Tax=Hohenbuehelia grisea TaxID=104357 RepID=A0ABR3JFR3_9AGAR